MLIDSIIENSWSEPNLQMHIYNAGWYALLIVFHKTGEKYFLVKYIYI